ncbi:LacI family DNA-binding transcriptional regulator [Aliirhizobium smilacinae]|uniref:LacI family transcriptional regulator n=1 Tax=Aliirhizobium smilacinae TaxID=1395944 RepID=A0A5C4XDU4_9HYPH|nr:LacI family DNA-binding transcriptional regulator [Rhizobium smilacinae]TNM61409.1 LacI family transcriptional regulator [Rhizobium smilacinae]
MSVSRTPATMTEIAAALGVSSATVSNALSGKGRVSAELTAKIRQATVDLGYVPSQAARTLRTGRTGVIGLVLPDISNPLFPQIAQAIEQAAAAAGYGVLIADSRGEIAQQTAAIGRLIERGVDGIIIVPRRGSRVGEIGTPVAIIDSPSTPGNTVSSDHWDGGVQMGRHLAGLGHCKVLLIAQSSASNVQNDRIGGLKAGLGKNICHETLLVENLEAIKGAGCALGLAAKVADGFTAFAAVYDLLALRALTELQRDGTEVPRQASVSGFDDLVWSSVVTPPITTLRQDLATIAERAVEALSDAITDSETPFGGPAVAKQSVEGVAMTLVVRQSTGQAMEPVVVPVADTREDSR